MISSRIQSTAIAYVRAVVIAIKWSAVKIRRHLVNKHDGSAVVVAPAACFTKNAKCVQGILYFVAEDFVTDFFLLTLQERVILGQNGRETNKKNNHLANLAPEEFHTCLFSTHPRL